MDLNGQILESKSQLLQTANGHDQIQDLRTKAMQVFENEGFPTIKHEEWKYTSLVPILRKNYSLTASAGKVSKEEVEKYSLKTDSYRLVFVDGGFSEEHSDLENAPFTFLTLSNALGSKEEALNLFGKIAPIEDQAFVALNTAFAHQGSFLHIPKGTRVEKPIELLYFTSKAQNEAPFFQIRNLILAEQASETQIYERHQNLGESAALSNVVTEIKVERDAIYDHYKVQNDQRDTALVDNTWVEQAENSFASVDTFSLGGRFVRNNLSFLQRGEHCESKMYGITMIGENQLVDHHTLVDHKVPNCQSNQLYKGIYTDNAKGVFNGKVYVHSEAQKTNAFQQNDNVLLDDLASLDTKPQLEIFADDVKCSHGCTIGQLDEDAMFYLKSRGIRDKEARAMLLYAFCMDALAGVKLEELKSKLKSVLAKKLGVELDFDL